MVASAALAALVCTALVQDPALLTGRLLDADGTPIPGARLELRAHPSDPELAATWRPPEERVSGADGRFEARFAPPGVPVAGVLRLPDGGRLTWTWSEVAPGETIDLGEVRLPLGAVVAGRIALPDGDVLTEGWRVRLDLEHRLPGGARLRVQREALPSATSGEFRFEDVPALPLELRAAHELGYRVESILAEVAAGGERFVELVHHGVDPRHALNVKLVHPALAVRAGPLVAVAASGDEIVGTPNGFAPGVHLFTGLARAAHTLELRDPLFERMVARGVTPGHKLELRVRGSASLRLTVTDGADGPQLERYGLRLRLGVDGPVHVLRTDGARAPADGRVEDIVPLPSELEVRAPGRAPVRVRLDDLAPGGEYALTVVVPGEGRLPLLPR